MNQTQWDAKYHPTYRSRNAPVGLHIFNAHDKVVRVDGREGRVISRTALTADVKWDDDQSQETIEQFDRRYQCVKRR